jgi:hypothetical protein
MTRSTENVPVIAGFFASDPNEFRAGKLNGI